MPESSWNHWMHTLNRAFATLMLSGAVTYLTSAVSASAASADDNKNRHLPRDEIAGPTVCLRPG